MTPTETITVTARFKIKPGLEGMLRRELDTVMALTRNETGCISYNLHQSDSDPLQFLMLEQWVSQEALDEHLQMPYIKSLFVKAAMLLAEPVELDFWKSLI
ncbi:hypothetical protein BST81_14180 [Leptolyngbya sp. 'hensonii']|uniref:putative quinol monooxygenase n=1 Tax=Leptolyngbya sp. 'hensonii' TaxID=1922337 RepID=UPI00094FE418|nr:putative quinol monooxygenase [Leptolyngbya sp. 'hensonii']OLP18160.1 hypothetical protein BST81_14180 [Leptolyngbya sp. 'hensonii']